MTPLTCQGMMRLKSDWFYGGVMKHGGGGTSKICFMWIAEKRNHMEANFNM